MGGRISMAREAMQLSIAQAARRLGVKTSSWRAWETDSAAPRANRVAMMAGILGVSPSWLLMGKGPGPSEDSPIRLDTVQLHSLLRDLRMAMAEAASAQQRVQDLVGQLEALNHAPNGKPALAEGKEVF
ncbi:helix-turn-helix domain-containing protein [Mesorhizobium sp. RMAD-H1]|uniref:helix-turn-helix domain-containing protein n=1 Tax=Mesorhizobium sp. RMAD-H1 TaxID=2587065 RepID=UPI0016107DDD|nr:helix-turn-helix domain-containing protein [Mesorhizobium sp. RMAD-H1]MBB2971697.1 transcriptional regulator with XRE-family HTH domain [Mesorhizobium sp. RMAD-H1]